MSNKANMVLSGLTEEEREQFMSYAEAIKETKKAMKELIQKSKKSKTESWGGSRKDMVMTVEKKLAKK